MHAIIPYQIPDQFTSTSIKIYFICLWLALFINTIERLSACVMYTSALCTLSKLYLSLLNAYIFWPSFPSAALIYLFSIIPCVLCAVPAANIIYWKSSIFAKKYAIFGCNQYRNVFHLLLYSFVCLILPLVKVFLGRFGAISIPNDALETQNNKKKKYNFFWLIFCMFGTLNIQLGN